MKALFSVLLGLMLLTSLVGISYATPVMQPTQNTSGDNCGQQSPGNWNYNVTPTCHGDSHVGGTAGDPPSNSCLGGQKADFACCGLGQKADTTCCEDGITPHAPEVSDIQTNPEVPCG